MTANSNNKKAVAHETQQEGVSLRLGSRSVLTIVLLLVLVYLQVILWFGEGSLSEVWRLKQSIESLEAENKVLLDRNQQLIDEVEALRQGLELIEYRARKDLGLIKENEIFYYLIQDPDNNPEKTE